MKAGGLKAGAKRIVAASGGPANVLAIGTTVPPFVHEPCTYPDYYFSMTNCNQDGALGEFKRISAKLWITKRNMVVRKELLEKHPGLASHTDNSTSTHQREWVSKMAIAAVEAAIANWGGSKADITHVVVSSTSVVNLPGLDLFITSSAGLDASKVRRVMLYYIGCHAGGTALRVVKDIAENNKALAWWLSALIAPSSLPAAPGTISSTTSSATEKHIFEVHSSAVTRRSSAGGQNQRRHRVLCARPHSKRRAAVDEDKEWGLLIAGVVLRSLPQ